MTLTAMTKEKIINFRIDASLKDSAKKLAEADGRSLSNWITVLIQKEVKRQRKKD
jgi:antitoxin component of RelBE/YafQ-DinJ toxin-antitoxin module